jgi:hypothetical protein
LDNASNNDTCVVKLERLLTVCDIEFCALENHIMCFAHIINICCQYLVESFTNPALIDLSEPFVASEPPNDPCSQSFTDAIKRDPIVLGRVMVHKLRLSGQRREHLSPSSMMGTPRAISLS